jgi:predicted TIM-barrel fold metal-dependent hydrolase
MSISQRSRSEEIRDRLNHPVIDSDGHIIEFEPGVTDHLAQIAGPLLAKRFREWEQGFFAWYEMSKEQRQTRRATRPGWWMAPSKNTLDRATATLPGLLYDRLGEMGIDFSVIYPTLGLAILHMQDEELQQAACRALNTFHAEIFRRFSDRLTPVAIIPMQTPAGAIQELEHAVKTLKMKAVLLAGYVKRPVADIASQYPQVARYACWLDTFGLDSEYDYDSVWSKCIELKVPVATHSTGMGWGGRVSVSNFVANHTGHFASSGEALCRSLFMGGVTRRFPDLKFAFLEGGAGWGCNLYAGLLDHWRKRNLAALENYNPENLDRDMLARLYSQYGDFIGEDLDRVWEARELLEGNRELPEMLDEWVHCEIHREEDFRRLFVDSFYFGCEADDPITAWAFNTRVNPLSTRLKVLFGSDIGHFDVPDMRNVVAEAYELVEEGLITSEDFRDFVFTNPVSFYQSLNDDFFSGTAVEQAARNLPDQELGNKNRIDCHDFV